MTIVPNNDDTFSIEPDRKRIEAARHEAKRGPAAAALPDSIGPYRILQQLGEGGMGVVYLAEQTAPIHRRVALKIIKLGMDTKHVIARFETERELRRPGCMASEHVRSLTRRRRTVLIGRGWV